MKKISIIIQSITLVTFLFSKTLICATSKFSDKLPIIEQPKDQQNCSCVQNCLSCTCSPCIEIFRTCQEGDPFGANMSQTRQLILQQFSDLKHFAPQTKHDTLELLCCCCTCTMLSLLNLPISHGIITIPLHIAWPIILNNYFLNTEFEERTKQLEDLFNLSAQRNQSLQARMKIIEHYLQKPTHLKMQ